MSTPITVLLADDDEAFLDTYQKILENDGLEVFLARDGEEASRRALQERPDIVILDVDMPKKDGMAVMRDLRTTEWGKDVPIIILTGKDADSERFEQINLWSPAYYLVKGNQSAQDLITAIKNLVRR